jgi:hypothetical protein
LWHLSGIQADGGVCRAPVIAGLAGASRSRSSRLLKCRYVSESLSKHIIGEQGLK